ncbi:MAG: hypothetical protein U9O94_00435 [Nanoarchaeota archaeon]|nr:hypothetical protein [Nanoarchaeota archaeon]
MERKTLFRFSLGYAIILLALGILYFADFLVLGRPSSKYSTVDRSKSKPNIERASGN